MISPAGRKNVVPSVRSKSSMISAAESTGSASSSRIAVMKSAQTVSGSRKNVIPGARMLMIVVMKFTAVSSDESPRIRSAISQSVWPLGWIAESGA